jgi:methionyl-tRNA synthetase
MRYYLTTPIYYVNDVPHIGSAYTTVAADILARFHRLRGEEVLFATGTDENAPKVLQAAQERGAPVREYVDRVSEHFRTAWERLNISHDVFIRTTEERHVRAVQTLFRTLQERGDIYKGVYEGWYCLSDETFFSDEEVVKEERDGQAIVLCPNPECGRPVQRVQEENYFFALSRYGDRLLQHVEAHPEFLQPDFRRNEVLAFIREGLRDVAITRSAYGWGIPVPRR